MASLQTFRRDAAGRLGLLDVYTTSAQASGGGANEKLIVAEFGDAAAQTQYENAWAYPVTGAITGPSSQRRARSAGLSPSTSTLSVTRGWAAPLAAGVEVEILRLIPAVRELGRQGWREIINDVLADIPIEKRYPITATAGTVAYASLPSWFEAEHQVVGIYDPGVSGENPDLSDNLRAIRADGETLTMELWAPYAAGSVFTLALAQPAATRIRAGGVWGDSAVGLVNDADEAFAHRALVRAMAIQRAAEMELERPDPRNKSMFEGTLARWTPIAASLKRQLAPRRPTHLRAAPTTLSAWPKGLF